jgi:hypothetical protein
MFAMLTPLPAQAPSPAIVGVKLMRAETGAKAEPFRVELPPGCQGCSVLQGAVYQGQNPREIFFHLRVPASMTSVSGVRVIVGETHVRAVIVEKQRIPFATAGGAITFDVPVVPQGRSSTVEVQTSLTWPGIVLRVEHAFPDRRAGKYATGEFPVVQRAAALNLEFGFREALSHLKLDREVETRRLGKIHLMGFDTNNPLGHEDYPPHIHVILRWPQFAGSQAPHYYLSDRGLLLPDVSVTIDGMSYIHATQIGKGTWIPAVDYLGETLFETLVTADGGIALRRPGGASCELKPLGPDPRGYADGALVDCGSEAVYRVRASDDTERGELRVSVNSRPPEVYLYDTDTAELLSAQPAAPRF